jgi:hypothetical protein
MEEGPKKADSCEAVGFLLFRGGETHSQPTRYQ